MKNSFLAWVHSCNADYDTLERASRHHIVIHVWILVMVVAGLLPMILSITNSNVDFESSAQCMLALCIGLIILFRVPYKKGKLNKYKM